MKLQYIVRKNTSEVELFKDEQYPLGISITGGQKDGCRPTITNIKHGSVAHKSHCLSEGDVILSVRGYDTRGMSKKDVKRYLKDSDPHLNMKVEYITQEAYFGYCRIYSCQRMSLTLKKINGAFGFVLRKNSGFAEYPVISNIKHNTPADRDGIMMSGDRVLAVDNLSLSWIPLAEIANVLQDKEEAEFLIEYNVGVVDLSQEKETHLEITCPNTDLGMTLTSDRSLKMSISYIQQGSLAERCGVFHVGDEILSINGIDIKTMTSDKANDLLRRFRKTFGSITFLHNGENPKLETSDCHSTSKIVRTSPSITPPTFVPPNSWASLYCDPIPEYVFFKTVKNHENHNDYQLQIMSILRSILTHTDNLQLNLLNDKLETSSSHNEVFIKDDSSESEKSNDLMGFRGQVHELRKLTHNLVIYVLKNAAQLNYDFVHSARPQNHHDSFSGSSVSDRAKIEFIDSLNMFANRRLMSKNSVKKLIASAVDINKNCWVCVNEFYTASFAVRKVHLFITLYNKPQQEINTIRKVLKKVSQLPFPCHDCNRPSSAESTAEIQSSQSDQKVENSLIPPRTFGVGASSSSSDSNKVIRRETYSVNGSQIQTNPPIGFNLTEQTVKYTAKLNEDDNSTVFNSQSFNSSSERYTPISSSRSNEHSSSSGNHQDAANNHVCNCTMKHDNLDVHHNDTLSKASSTITSLTEADKQRRIPNEDYESHPPVRPKSPFERHSTPKPPTSKVLCQCRSSTGFEIPNADAPPIAGPSHDVDHNPVKTISKKNSLKTYTDVHEVCLKSENGSFGFILGYSSLLQNDENHLPIISAIKPKSAAHKCGLMKKGDRILALNGFSTAGISIGDLESLKREMFHSDEVVLTVEFDVTEEETDVTGTFTVELETCLKLGLVMDEPNYPSFVRGLVKGSSSHRSGQLLPGDEILSFSTLKSETLNLQTWTMRKTKTHRITIRRETDNLQKRELTHRNFDFPLNPVSFVRSGSQFNIKRTSIRTIEGVGGCKDKMILEQEFTLFRDPQTWDFGFLFGENPKTGNAYITDIRPGGPADKSKIVKKYDRIMEVNGVLVDNTAENSVMTLFMQTDDRVDLVTRRVLHYT